MVSPVERSRQGQEAKAAAGATSMTPFLLGVVGLATASVAITLAVSEPPPGLDKRIYFLVLSGFLLAGVTQVGASVWLADDASGRRAAWWKHLVYASMAPLVVAFCLSVASPPSW